MEKYYGILLHPALITTLIVYIVVMVSRAVYLLANNEFPHFAVFIFGEPYAMMISIFGLGLGIIFGFPFALIGFILMCILIPIIIWGGVVIAFQLLAFVFELF